MNKSRILELAIKELESQRATLSAEIDTLRSELRGTAARPSKKGSPQNAAARKAQSLRMKNYWASKRAKASKAEAAKKALSLKMKEIWRKKKAQAAKKKKA